MLRNDCFDHSLPATMRCSGPLILTSCAPVEPPRSLQPPITPPSIRRTRGSAITRTTLNTHKPTNRALQCKSLPRSLSRCPPDAPPGKTSYVPCSKATSLICSMHTFPRRESDLHSKQRPPQQRPTWPGKTDVASSTDASRTPKSKARATCSVRATSSECFKRQQ